MTSVIAGNAYRAAWNIACSGRFVDLRRSALDRIPFEKQPTCRSAGGLDGEIAPTQV